MKNKKIKNKKMNYYLKVKKTSNRPVLGEDYKDQDVVKISDEGEEQETDFGNKLFLGIEFNNGEKKRMLLNNTSKNNLIDEYSDDTAKWVGKEVKINIVKTMVSGKPKDVVYLTHPNKDLEGNTLAQ